MTPINIQQEVHIDFDRGGFFAGKIASTTTEVESGSRFDSNLKSGEMYRKRYLVEGYFKVCFETPLRSKLMEHLPLQ